MRSSASTVGRLFAAARLVLLVAVAAVAGCHVDATGLLVTLRMSGGASFGRIAVEVLDGAEVKAAGEYATRAIVDGDTFGVPLPESLDGHEVMVRVTAYAAASDSVPLIVGATKSRVTSRQAVSVEVVLAANLADGGADGPDEGTAPDLDMAGVDLAGRDMVDLASADMARDLSMPDLAMPDLATADLAGDMTMFPVGTCATARELDAALAMVDVMGAVTSQPSAHGGSCQPDMGAMAEDVWHFKLTDFQVVQLDVKNAGFSPTLYVRSTCSEQAVPAPKDVLMRRSCVAAIPSVTQACASGTASLSFCSLPPGDYFAYVDSNGPGGYSLSAKFSKANLDASDCVQAGTLLPPYPVISGDTTQAPLASQSKSTSGNNCGPAGDQGVNSKEQVYWLPMPDPWATATIEVRTTDVNFKPLLYVRDSCGEVSNSICSDGANNGGSPKVTIPNATGTLKQQFFLFVDGLQGTAGAYTLHVTVN